MKPPKIPSIISIVILTTITLVFWVFFEILRTFISKPTLGVPPSVTESISPNLDRATLDKVQSAIFFDDSQIPQSFATSTPLASPSLVPTPSIGPTSTPSAIPTATPGGGNQ